MAPPTITIYGLEKSFGSSRVLNGVDLTLRASEINFIIGASGGGKSVLLKHLVGLLEPDCGGVWYDNQQMSGQSSSFWAQYRPKMALLFQDGALFDSLSVGQNVAFPLTLRGDKEKEAAKQAYERLEELGLAPSFHKRPSQLSAGERKRVALARALILEPELLLFDEPTTGLDPLLSQQVDDLIVEALKRTKATVVVVSHDIAATLNIAHHIAMIDQGRIILSGSPQDFKNTENQVVKEFLWQR